MELTSSCFVSVKVDPAITQKQKSGVGGRGLAAFSGLQRLQGLSLPIEDIVGEHEGVLQALRHDDGSHVLQVAQLAINT